MKINFRIFFFLFFSVTSGALFGQKNVQARIDSLETVSKTATDTSKIKVLLELCASYQQTDPNNVNS